MKKWIHSVIAVLLACICLLPGTAFAADNTDTVPEGGYIADLMEHMALSRPAPAPAD